MLFEHHSTDNNDRCVRMKEALEKLNIDVILANSTSRLSKYHSTSPEEKSLKIYVVDQYDEQSEAYPTEESTKIFQKYEEIRRIERLYVSPENYLKALQYIKANKL